MTSSWPDASFRGSERGLGSRVRTGMSHIVCATMPEPDQANTEQRRQLRILGLSEGDERTAMSGVPGHVFDALGRRFTIVERLDYGPTGAARLVLAASTFRPGRARWRARFHTSLRAHRTLSSNLARRLELGVPEFDVALQVHGWVARQPRPYVLYTDQTRLMAERGWPDWLALEPRHREQIIALEREMYAGASYVFAMGTPTQDSLMTGYGVDPAAITVVGGGLNLASLPPRGELTVEPTVLFVGRDFERKGGDWLLRAFARVRREMPSATLHIVGPERRFDQPGVTGHGRIADRGAVAALYERARVFCMPSRYEPWGLVFPEAMSYGIPCVGSVAQSIPEIIGDGEAGLLVEIDDERGLAEALVTLLTDDELARRLGAAGRRRVEHLYTWDRVADRMAPGLLAAAGLQARAQA
jgi:glycosyltransferase involved in cell wall biosynthesis